MILGIERRAIASALGGEIEITIVLVQGENNDVCAYIGHGPTAWVAAHGDKLPVEEVNTYFPGFERTLAFRGLTYRR